MKLIIAPCCNTLVEVLQAIKFLAVRALIGQWDKKRKLFSFSDGWCWFRSCHSIRAVCFSRHCRPEVHYNKKTGKKNVSLECDSIQFLIIISCTIIIIIIIVQFKKYSRPWWNLYVAWKTNWFSSKPHCLQQKSLLKL